LKADLIEFRNQLISQESELIRRGATTQRLSPPQLEDGKIKMKFEYQRLIPGRVELMERVDTEIEILIEPTTDAQWQIVCYPQANQDIKIIESLFTKLGKKSYTPFTISLENFRQQQKIQFFDTVLNTYSIHSEWRFLEVTEITVKQPTSDESNFLLLNDENDSNLLEEGNESDREATKNDLSSINQAILQGKNLRTNSFIKDCEKQGFYFPSMTLRLDNKNTSEVISVEICFKLSPKMFEIILVDMANRTELGECPAVFSENRQQEILKNFWITCHTIWRDIYKDIAPLGSIEQLSFASYINQEQSDD
jgi:hypothetical protein